MATVKSYGERFQELRRQHHLTQEVLAERLGLRRQGNVSKWETDPIGVPLPATILKHAQAIGCRPSDLLAGVATLYDRVRFGEFDDPAARDAFLAKDAERVRQLPTEQQAVDAAKSVLKRLEPKPRRGKRRA